VPQVVPIAAVSLVRLVAATKRDDLRKHKRHLRADAKLDRAPHEEAPEPAQPKRLANAGAVGQGHRQ
jgi:hypothetical protein